MGSRISQVRFGFGRMRRAAVRRSTRRAHRVPFHFGLMLLATLVSACGDSRLERVGSGAGIGAGTGAVIGLMASPPVAGSLLVGAAVGGTGGLIVHEHKIQSANEPTGIVLSQLLEEQARLWNVAAPIMASNVDICRDRTRPSFGFVAWTRWEIDSRYRFASMDIYGLDEQLRVVHILPDSPAAQSGLVAGDVIEGVGEHSLPAGKAASAALEEALQRDAKSGVALAFHVRRGSERLTYEIAPQPVCDFNLILTRGDRIQGFHRGSSIYMSDGLLRFAAEDDHLAAMIAHFVGHALLEHEPGDPLPSFGRESDKMPQETQTLPASEELQVEANLTGAAFGGQHYNVIQEIQADQAALELLAPTDYPAGALIEVWQRLMEEDGGHLMRTLHPTSPHREEAVKQILNQVWVDEPREIPNGLSN